MGRRVLKFDGAFGPEGCGIALRAMNIKSALRDWLTMSYGMISITVISHLRWHSPLWCLTAPKGGMHFLARRAVVWFFLLPQGSIYTGAHKDAHHNPRARGASNLSPLRTFGPKGRQPSSPIGACPYGAHHNPRAGGASNLRTFGAIAPSNFRTFTPHRGVSPKGA